MKLLFLLIVTLSFSVFSQSNPLTNKDVIDLSKAGIGDDIIIAKIKSSKCEFDTTSNSIVELKKSGVSDNIVLAVLDCSRIVETKPFAKNDLVYTIADAAKKRRVFIDSEDAQSELAIIKQLKKGGFDVVSTRAVADLVIEFSVEKTQGVSLFLWYSTYERSNGKLAVYLRADQKDNLIYAKSDVYGYLPKQAEKLTGDFVKALIKTETSK